MAGESTTGNFDEFEYIARIEAANTDEFAYLLLNASPREQAVLSKHFGEPLFRRLHQLAIQQKIMREGWDKPKNTVVIIPGLMGSQLTSTDLAGHRQPLWLNLSRLAKGGYEQLRMGETERSEGKSQPRYTVRATGILKRYYGELMLTLAAHWRVQAFWYDWRQDFELNAAALALWLAEVYSANEPVTIIAHGTGGLVARWYIHHHPQRWNMRSGKSRLLLLGTSNHGTFVAPLALAGLPCILRWPQSWQANGEQEYQVNRTFPSLYQLLPSPVLLAGSDPALAEKLYQPQSYGFGMEQYADLLRRAKASHELLAESYQRINAQQIYSIIGYNQPTIVGLRQIEMLAEIANAQQSGNGALVGRGDSLLEQVAIAGMDGDGFVQQGLCRLTSSPTLYLEEKHGLMPSNPRLLAALTTLLQPQLTRNDLPDLAKELEWRVTSPRLGELAGSRELIEEGHNNNPSRNGGDDGLRGSERSRGGEQQPAPSETEGSGWLPLLNRQSQQHWQAMYTSEHTAVERALRLLPRLTTEHSSLSGQERTVEQYLTRHLLITSNASTSSRTFRVPFDPPKITIQVLCGDFVNLDSTIKPKRTKSREGEPEIDALAIGHIQNTSPLGLIGALDQMISRDTFDDEFDQVGGAQSSSTALPADQCLLWQYAERGILRCELAQVFFLNDPRLQHRSRAIAIAGMGLPGRFGQPELTVLARELCWSVGRLGKRHLATALIGTGAGGRLSIRIAALAWMRGLKLALTGVEDGQKLTKITFVVNDAAKADSFYQALKYEIEDLHNSHRMIIDLEPLLTPKQSASAPGASPNAPENGGFPGPYTTQNRLTVTYSGEQLRFGALTDDAAIPERSVPLNYQLIREANDKIVTVMDSEHQRDYGEFMERLLLPRDLRDHIRSDEPLVLIVDRETARLHWEMLSSPDPVSTFRGARDDRMDGFWATTRGLTRQLRTGFAPPPEPPPPTKRILRVLVIADPAADLPLPGAVEEGMLVADLFDHFNKVHADKDNRIEVVRLIGPHAADWVTVLSHLLTRTYDVVHFAGHCIYDRENPARSGWIFSKEKRLTAAEFSRIDRVPQFVFSNCCESGLTPDSASERSVEFAPSFAESFFQQGVINFVCTAWPVDDQAARDFALTFYAQMLGLEYLGDQDGQNSNAPNTDARGADVPKLPPGKRPQVHAYQKGEPQFIYEAMRRARRAIARAPFDPLTWGAYQHYGNPFYRFFNVEHSQKAPLQATSPAVTATQTRTDGGTAAATAESLLIPLDFEVNELPIPKNFRNVVGETSNERLPEITSLLQVDKARKEFEVSGAGLAVAVIDSGLFVNHPDFQNAPGRIPFKFNFGDGAEGNVTDQSGHGTHVTGLIAANGVNKGIAHDAKIIPLRATNGSNISGIRMLDALLWVIDHHAEYNIAVVCLSYGLNNYSSLADMPQGFQGLATKIQTAIQDLRDLNVPVVISSGNSYGLFESNPGMGFPAILAGAISVGSVFDANIDRFENTTFGVTAFSTAADRIAPYSQRQHESVNGNVFTTFFAPGSSALSTSLDMTKLSENRHGTSMAAPVAAGVILLMQEYYLRKEGVLPSVDDLVKWLRASGKEIIDGDDEEDDVEHSGLSYRRIDALAALREVKKHL